MTETKALFVGTALVLALGACTDPVGDAPRATVAEAAPAPADEPADKPADKPTGQPADGEADDDARAAGFTFNQEGSRIDFVGAKVTKKHDGGFKGFSGTIEAPDGELRDAKVNVEIDMSTVFTDTEKLTGHLKSEDFFDVAKFPKATFTSTSITPSSDGTSTVTGELTMHGVTKQISFPATLALTEEGATAKAEFGINRKDFGIVYPGAPDDLIRDEVLLKLDVAAKKQ